MSWSHLGSVCPLPLTPGGSFLTRGIFENIAVLAASAAAILLTPVAMAERSKSCSWRLARFRHHSCEKFSNTVCEPLQISVTSTKSSVWRLAHQEAVLRFNSSIIKSITTGGEIAAAAKL